MVLRELKNNPETTQIPVIINTSKQLNGAEQAELQSLAVGVVSKNERDPNSARETVYALLAKAGVIE
jgi:CheY-like chemotaxis protein